MAVRTWEAEMNMDVWFWFKDCNCGGAFNVQYRRRDNPNALLKVYPSNQTFRYYNATRLVYGGKLSGMIDYLNRL